MSSTLLTEDTGVPFDELQAEQIQLYRDAWAEAGLGAHAARLGVAQHHPPRHRPGPRDLRTAHRPATPRTRSDSSTGASPASARATSASPTRSRPSSRRMPRSRRPTPCSSRCRTSSASTTTRTCSPRSPSTSARRSGGNRPHQGRAQPTVGRVGQSGGMTPAARPIDTRADALAALRDLVGRDDAEFHDGQFEAIEALVDGRPPRARRAAHRLGQVGGVLRRDAAAPPPGRGPDRARVPAARAHARPDRRRRARRRAGGGDQLDEPARVGRRAAHDSTATRSTCCSSRPSASTTRRSASSSCRRSCAASACSSSTRRTASATGATTSGPTTGACATSSPGCPAGVPVLATTATANSRGCVAGSSPSSSAPHGTSVTPRSSRSAGRWPARRCGSACCACPTRTTRLGWLLSHLDDLPGSGIIYTLTVSAAEDTARLLREAGHEVRAYTGQTDHRRARGVRGAPQAQRGQGARRDERARHGLRQARPRLRACTSAPHRRPSPTTSRSGARGVRPRTPTCCCCPAPRTATSGSTSRPRRCPTANAPTRVIDALERERPTSTPALEALRRHPPHPARAAAQGARRRRCGAARAGRLGRHRRSRGSTTPSATSASRPSASPSSST